MKAGFDVVMVGKRNQRSQAQFLFDLPGFEAIGFAGGKRRSPIDTAKVNDGVAIEMNAADFAFDHMRSDRDAGDVFGKAAQILAGMHGMAVQGNSRTPPIEFHVIAKAEYVSRAMLHGRLRRTFSNESRQRVLTGDETRVNITLFS